MSTITVDELKALTEKVSADSDIVASLGKSISISVSKSSIFARSIALILLSRGLLKRLNKIESACSHCAATCNADFDFRADLERVVTAWDGVILKKEKVRFPNFILRHEKNLLEEFENKLENYWIASDKEIKELAHSVSEGLNQRALR